MNVLHVIPSIAPRYGGPSQAVLGIGRALAEQNLEVLIATTDADGPGVLATPLGVPLDCEGVRVILFRRQWSEALKYSRPLAAWLDRHVGEYAVVHIHAVFSHACLAAARACQKRGVPYIVRPLGTLDPWSLRQKPLRKQVLWRLGARRMLQHAAAVHYTTRAEQRLAESALGLSRGVVIPLGIDQPARANVQEFRTRRPAIGDHPYVLILGRLHPKKGVEGLIEAFGRVTQAPADRGWRLVIAGDGDPTYVTHLKQLAGRQPEAERIVFLGWVAGEEKLATLQAAALLALPSHQENFGLVVMESLACGVPVLVSEQVNLADDVRAADAGWVVPLDARALEDALAEALHRGDERQRRGAAGQALASRFTWPRVATELIELYRGVARSAC